MDIRKLDVKTVAIVILTIAVVVSFFFGQRSNIVSHDTEIEALHQSINVLNKRNDSILTLNTQLDTQIAAMNMIIENNKQRLSATQSQIDNLTKKKHAIPTYVNHLSADNVTSTLTDFLERNTKDTDVH